MWHWWLVHQCSITPAVLRLKSSQPSEQQQDWREPHTGGQATSATNLYLQSCPGISKTIDPALEMDSALELAAPLLTGLLLAVARLGPLVWLLPLPQGWQLGWLVRTGLLLGLLMMVIPVAWPSLVVAASRPLHETLPSELLVGLALACGVAAVVWSVALAGVLMGQLSGVESTAAFDPSGEAETGPLASVVGWLALVIVLTSGGHRAMLDGLLTSFVQRPLGAAIDTQHLAAEVLALPAEALLAGWHIAAPIVAAGLAAVLLVGLAGRLVPQGPLVAMSLSVQMLVVAVAWLACWGPMVDQLESTTRTLSEQATRSALEPSSVPTSHGQTHPADTTNPGGAR